MKIEIPIDDAYTELVIEALCTNYGYTGVVEKDDKVIPNPLSREEFVAAIFNTIVYANVRDYKLKLAETRIKQEVADELAVIIGN
jgi:hypothetical protein